MYSSQERYTKDEQIILNMHITRTSYQLNPFSAQLWSAVIFSSISSYEKCNVKKLAGDLLLGLELVKVSVLPTQLIDFLYERLGELRSRSLRIKWFRRDCNNWSSATSMNDKLFAIAMDELPRCMNWVAQHLVDFWKPCTTVVHPVHISAITLSRLTPGGGGTWGPGHSLSLSERLNH